MKILFLSRWYPFPPNNGSKLRIYNLLDGLARQHEVSLLSFAAEAEISPQMEKPASPFQEIRVVPWKPFDPNSRQSRAGFFSTTPRAYLDTFSQELAGNITEMLSANNFDLVIASQIDMAAYGRYFQNLPAIFEEAEVGILYDQFKKAASPIKRLRYWLTWFKHRQFLASTLQNFKGCTVVSAQEEKLLATAVPNLPPIQVVPNGVDLSIYQNIREDKEPNTLIFTGALSFKPNYEAMVWFLEEVFPMIRQEIHGARLTITGDHRRLPLPDSQNVTLTGFIDDIRPLVARSMCSIVPILSGGGTRLKILESMGLGTPVAATSKGAEGLNLVDQEHILLADKPEDFAQAVISLLTETDLNQKLTRNALQLVKDQYNWPVILPQLFDLINQVIPTN